MAIRVQTQADVVFGTMAAAVTATHGRFQKAAGLVSVVRPLAANVTAAAGERLRIPSGMLDVVYPAGQLTNTHMLAVVNPYWEGETFQLDLMTDDSTVIADGGYSQQTYSNWAISQEAD